MATASKNLSDHNINELPDGKSFCIAIVVSEWNDSITNNLLKGAFSVLEGAGVKKKNIVVKFVPGSYELALGAQSLLKSIKKLDAIICLGSIIQGETKHFDFICNAAAQGIMNVGLSFNKPVIFGVLTDNNMQQAIDRSGGKLGNKGNEAAVSALKMIALQNSLKK